MTFVAASEYKLAGGREHAGPGFGMQIVIPDAFAGLRIEGAHRAVAGVFGKID